MSVSINIPFEELLRIISQLNREEKKQISELLDEVEVLTESHWQEAMERKRAFEAGEIESESWEDVKKRFAG
jgi:hypothetical protein